MTFNSIDELKNYLLSQSGVAIKIAQERIFKIIEDFLLKFYEEFSPEVYVRTYQLLCSLVKTGITSTGNGWTAEVYVDIGSLNYSNRIVPQGQPWSDYAKPENTYHREDWSDANTEWVVETAMTGSEPHGGYSGGTAIWTESMEEINRDLIKILRQSLIDAGIPVK